MSEAAWRPAALMTAMVLLGDDMSLLGGRKVTELFLEVERGEDSEYDERECLWCLPATPLERFEGSMRMGMLAGAVGPLICAAVMAAVSPLGCRMLSDMYYRTTSRGVAVGAVQVQRCCAAVQRCSSGACSRRCAVWCDADAAVSEEQLVVENQRMSAGCLRRVALLGFVVVVWRGLGRLGVAGLRWTGVLSERGVVVGVLCGCTMAYSLAVGRYVLAGSTRRRRWWLYADVIVRDRVPLSDQTGLGVGLVG